MFIFLVDIYGLILTFVPKPNGVLTNFSSIIVRSMGFTQFQTVLLDIPASLMHMASLIGSGYFAGKLPYGRTLMAVCVRNIMCLRLLDTLFIDTNSPVHWKLCMYCCSSSINIRPKGRKMGVSTSQ